MRKSIAVASVIAVALILSVVAGFQLVKAQSLTPMQFRYQSSMFQCQAGDNIKTNIINLDSSSHTVDVVVFGTTSGATLTVAYDSGSTSVSGGTGAHLDYTLPSGSSVADYGVQITTNSETMVPSVNVIPSGANYPRYWQGPGELLKFKDQY